MKLLSRYIAQTIVQATALVALIITSVLLLISLLTEAKALGEGDYGFLESVIYVLMCLPSQLYHFSPMLILMGTILGLSMLSSSRELAVMRASGFSIRKIMWSVFLGAFALTMTMGLFGEWFGPSLSYKAEIRKENAKNAGQAVVTASGIWFHIENNFIHIQRVVGRQLLKGVTRYEFNEEHQLQAAYYADTLRQVNNNWQMEHVLKTSFYAERAKSQSIPSLPWELKINTNLLNVGLVDPDDMSLSKLVRFSHYLQQNGLQSREYTFNFWKRVVQPFASIVMIFLAIPFVLGAMRTSSLGLRMVVGVLVGFGFFILNAMLGQLCVVYQMPTLLAALIPPVLFGIFSVGLSRKLVKY